MRFFKRDRGMGFKQKLKVYFVAGLLVTLPVVGSLWILSLLLMQLTDYIYRFIDPSGMNLFWERALWRLVALFILFSVLVFIGMLARNYLGKKLIQAGEYLMSKIPVLNKVYSALKQIFESFWGDEKAVFRTVVLIEFPLDGVYSIGFVTSEPKGEFQTKIAENVVSVFIPLTPNPTSGYFILVSRDKVTKLNISVEDAMKMIISSGMVMPRQT